MHLLWCFSVQNPGGWIPNCDCHFRLTRSGPNLPFQLTSRTPPTRFQHQSDLVTTSLKILPTSHPKHLIALRTKSHPLVSVPKAQRDLSPGSSHLLPPLFVSLPVLWRPTFCFHLKAFRLAFLSVFNALLSNSYWLVSSGHSALSLNATSLEKSALNPRFYNVIAQSHNPTLISYLSLITIL